MAYQDKSHSRLLIADTIIIKKEWGVKAVSIKNHDSSASYGIYNGGQVLEGVPSQDVPIEPGTALSISASHANTLEGQIITSPDPTVVLLVDFLL